MPLVQAKCTSCGAILRVDSNKDAAICEFCSTPYIVEKAISNLKVVSSGNLNINSAVVNIQGGNPTVNNLVMRANEFLYCGQTLTAMNYYNRVLDLDISNKAARAGINRIYNEIVCSVPVNHGFSKGKLNLTRLYLVFEHKSKRQSFPLNTIANVSRSARTITISVPSQNSTCDYNIDTAKNATIIENAIKYAISSLR